MVAPEELMKRLAETSSDAFSMLVNFRVKSKALKAWKAAARREDVPLSRWVRNRLNAAAEAAEGQQRAP
jgi:predicted HicB family RNase H-like nuclease